MELYKIFVVLLTLISLNQEVAPLGPAPPPVPNFKHALQLIDSIKPSINYSQFCVQVISGTDKIACHIKEEQTVVLLVCKSATVEGTACDDVINTELKNLANLQGASVSTVKFYNQPINGIKCGTTKELCSGFLEEWIGGSRGQFHHIRDAIVKGTVLNLIKAVKNFTTPAGLPKHVASLTAIKDYMEAPGTKYRQICDFQDFFFKDGGLQVNDVPEIREHLGLQDRCWENPEDPEPTTAQVLAALDTMISAFQRP